MDFRSFALTACEGSITDASGEVNQRWLESALFAETGRQLEGRLYAQRPISNRTATGAQVKVHSRPLSIR
jgi:hypothetical protein